MTWWCASSKEAWAWTWKPYIGAVLIVGGLIAVGIWWAARGRHQDATTAALAERDERGAPHLRGSSAGRTTSFVLGVALLWFCLDWPLASLGAGYLASAQMLRQVLMVMVVAPLLLFGTAPALAIRVIGWGRGLHVLRVIVRPVFAIPYAAGVLVAVNAPAVVDVLVPTPYGSFVLDAAWISAGFVLWMPVQCPHPGVRRLEGFPALAYLIGQSIVPVLPGFFMTWADFPIYSTYELAPRVFEGYDAVTDQQTAAAILQVGGTVLLWVQIAYRFLSWGYRQVEMDHTKRMREVSAVAP